MSRFPLAVVVGSLCAITRYELERENLSIVYLHVIIYLFIHIQFQLYVSK